MVEFKNRDVLASAIDARVRAQIRIDLSAHDGSDLPSTSGDLRQVGRPVLPVVLAPIRAAALTAPHAPQSP